MGTEIRHLKNVSRKHNSDQQEECEAWALGRHKSDISVRPVQKAERGISRNRDFLS